MNLKQSILILVMLITTNLGRNDRPLGGSIRHSKLTPKSLEYHKIIPNSKHDRIKANRKLKIELKDNTDLEDEEENASSSQKSLGELEFEVDEAIHENDHLEDEHHDDEEGEEGEGEEEEEESNEEKEESEENDGSKLEHVIVGVQIHRLDTNLNIFRELIINCIDRHYAKDMFIDQEIVTLMCLGERYEILERTYHDYLEQIHRIFDKIWKHKVSNFRDTYKDDIILFFNIVKMLTLKDLHLRKSLEVAHQNIKYTMDEKTFTAIMGEIDDEITAYDEIRDKLIECKDKIQEHLDEREREKQEAMDKLKETEEHMENEEIRYEDAHPEEEDEDEGGNKSEFDDGYEEEKSNLEDESEESVPEEVPSEETQDLSYDPDDERDNYDSEDASVGPEGESSPSLNSEQRLQALKNPHEPTPDNDVSEEKIDGNV